MLIFYRGLFGPRGRGGQVQSSPPSPRLPNAERGNGRKSRGGRGGNRGGRGAWVPPGQDNR